MGTPPSFKANLARRVITALVVLPVLLAALLLGPPLLGAAIVLVVLLLGLWEFFGLLQARADGVVDEPRVLGGGIDGSDRGAHAASSCGGPAATGGPARCCGA